MLTPTQEKAIREFVQLDERTKELIRGANWDLYCGPLYADEAEDQGIPNWPGFSEAVKEIANALDVRDLWLENDTYYVTDSEPDWSAIDDETGEVFYVGEFWTHLDARDVKRIVVGRELAQYL